MTKKVSSKNLAPPSKWHELMTSGLKGMERSVFSVDTHTAGETTRVLLGGMPEIEKTTTAEVRAEFQEKHDSLRRYIATEPRGHRDLVAAWPFRSEVEGVDFGLFFMDAYRYPYACGTATIGTVTALVECGFADVQGDAVSLRLDTPAGLIDVRAKLQDGKVESVSFDLVPSFVQSRNNVLTTSSGRNIRGDVVYVGGFLALVSAAELGVPLKSENHQEIAAIGDEIVHIANKEWPVKHPTLAEASTIDGVILYDPTEHDKRLGYGTVVYGASHVDRSPCGTGTAGKMTLLHSEGKLRVGEEFRNRGILGTEFLGKILSEKKTGDHEGIQVEITGSAHITGFHSFGLSELDPLPDGFLLGSAK